MANYSSHFGFSELPFENRLDPRFLYLSEVHEEALAALLYFVREEKSFAMVCGDVGTGKSMLISSFVGLLPPRVQPISIANPDVDAEEIVGYLAEKLRVPGKAGSVLRLLDAVKLRLIEEASRGNRYVLIVDEAQLLSDRSLETIRLLSNLQTARTGLLQILLAGQHELSRRLDSPRMKALRQRINVNRFLTPLSAEETVAYVDHRLRVVGSDFASCFQSDCSPVLFQVSGGIPRMINQVCDGALLICQAAGKPKVTPEMLEQARDAQRADQRQLQAAAPLAGGVARFTKRLPFVMLLCIGGLFLVTLLIMGFLGLL